MLTAFWIASTIAIVATAMVVFARHAVHALLYLVVSLFAVAVLFYLLGAPFAAALEVIIYAGAIMVLFVFVIMMLKLGPETVAQERAWLAPRNWVGPALLVAVLLAEWLWLLGQAPDVSEATAGAMGETVPARAVGIALFTRYLLLVEMAGLMLLAALVGAFHIGRRREAGEAP
ncbi:MAG: NADH-quinone oxidoreductase subunit J [Candidatus Wenzhouxiangella sp. M2_3B_020]